MTARKWYLWQVQRSDGRGLTVDEGTEAKMTGAANRRNETARRHDIADLVFVALPAGREPAQSDLPPLPDEKPPAPRTAADVTEDIVRLATAGKGSNRDVTAAVVRDFVAEACALAVKDQRAATARAWSAWLDLMMSVRLPEAGGKSLLQDVLDLEPELRERFEVAFLGGGDRA